MAIFNFVAGGYYKKLGQTVGQRWKNKRTVRSFVVPENPRTPAQQSNRGVFGSANKMAQIGLQMSRGAPAWRSQKMQEWAWRVQRARELEVGNASILDRIPLAPSGYVSAYSVSDVVFNGVSSSGALSFSVVGNLPAQERKISVAFWLPGSGGAPGEIVSFVSYLRGAPSVNFEIVGLDASLISENVYCRIVSTDDSFFNEEMILSVGLPVQMGGAVTRAFNDSVASVLYDDDYLYIQFAEPWLNFSDFSLSGTLHAQFLDDEAAKNFLDLHFVNLGGFFGLALPFSGVPWFERPLCSSSSYFVLGDFSVSTPSLILTNLEHNVSLAGLLTALRGTLSLTNANSDAFEFVFNGDAAEFGFSGNVIGAATVTDNYTGAAASRSVTSALYFDDGRYKVAVGTADDSGVCFSNTDVALSDFVATAGGCSWTFQAQTLANQSSALQVSTLPASLFPASLWSNSSEWSVWCQMPASLAAAAVEDFAADDEGDYGQAVLGLQSSDIRFIYLTWDSDPARCKFVLEWDEDIPEWTSGKIRLNLHFNDPVEFNPFDGIISEGKRWALPRLDIEVNY